MMGTTISDVPGVEGQAGAQVEGLGLLDVHTAFMPSKVLRLSNGRALGQPAAGYEIHHGRVTPGDGVDEFLGGARKGAMFGTMWHGSLESDGFRHALLHELSAIAGRADFMPGDVSFAVFRERRMDLLADLMEKHLDVDALLEVIDSGAATDLDLLPPGAE